MKHLAGNTRFKNAFLVTFLLSASLLLSSCSKDNPTNSNTTDPTGNWKITLYFDNTDETNDYNGYSFSFNTGGVLIASKAGTNTTGTWSQTSNKFIINFGTTPVLEELNDDWLIVEKTASSIKLKDDNPAQDDKLHFQKL